MEDEIGREVQTGFWCRNFTKTGHLEDIHTEARIRVK
jgi:hypothetical protein